MQIKEVIVVEGRDDEANIKAHVEAEIIITHGYGLSQTTLKRIQYAAETLGIIIFTDPDFVGNKIRKQLVEKVSGHIKHAYITRQEGTKDGDVGVENASGQAIRAALLEAKAENDTGVLLYSMQDMHTLGLVGDPKSSHKRALVGRAFRIGYGNAKQFLNRLNKYGINRQDLVNFMNEIEENNE